MNEVKIIEQTKIPEWKFIVWSISPSRYRELADSLLWPALVALLVIGALQSAIAVGFLASKWQDEVVKFSSQWEKSFPVLTIANGTATAEASLLVTGEITLMDMKMRVAVDTSGKTTEIDPSWSDGILLTTAEMIIKETVPDISPREQRIPYKKINELYGSITLDSKGIAELADRLKPQWLGSTFLGGIFRYSISKAMHIFVGILITLLIAAITKRPAKFIRLLKLSSYAMIPASIFEAPIMLVGSLLMLKIYQWLFFIYIAVYVAYLTLGALNLEKKIIQEEKIDGQGA